MQLSANTESRLSTRVGIDVIPDLQLEDSTV